MAAVPRLAILAVVGSHIHHNHVLILTLSAMTYQVRIVCGHSPLSCLAI